MKFIRAILNILNKKLFSIKSKPIKVWYLLLLLVISSQIIQGYQNGVTKSRLSKIEGVWRTGLLQEDRLFMYYFLRVSPNSEGSVLVTSVVLYNLSEIDVTDVKSVLVDYVKDGDVNHLKVYSKEYRSKYHIIRDDNSDVLTLIDLERDRNFRLTQICDEWGFDQEDICNPYKYTVSDF